MFSRNLEIKVAKKSVPDWAIAERLGISENSFYRMLRKEMSDEKKADILKIINDLNEEIIQEGQRRESK